MRQRRSCGLERPFSTAQCVTVVAYVGTTAAFYGFVSSTLARVVVGALAAVVVACFFFVSLVDPAVEATGLEARSVSRAYYCCFNPQTTTSQFVRDPSWCGICSKLTPGMDHHCPWLNTCIGRRNYACFFLIALCSTLQFVAQCVFGAIVLADDRASPVAWGHSAVAVVLVGLLGSLLVFHSLLVRKNIATLDLILLYRQSQRELWNKNARRFRVRVAPAPPSPVL